MFNDVFQGLGKSKPKGLLLPCCVSKSVLLSLGNSVLRQILSAGELSSTSPCAGQRVPSTGVAGRQQRETGALPAGLGPARGLWLVYGSSCL